MSTRKLMQDGCLAAVLAAALGASIITPSAVRADEAAQDAEAAPRRFVTEGSGTFGGERLRYRATVQEHILTSPAGEAAASVFTTAYVRTDARGADRPVMFAFNGGPGSSSIWLHLGYLGPQRVDFDDPAQPRTVAPFTMTANPDSPLDVADIVLIDPPGTGYSRVLPGGRTEQFYGVTQDATAVMQVIRQWLEANHRQNSPKFLISESYGTVRAAALAKLLAGGPFGTGAMEAITLNGIILVGQSMDGSARGGGDGDDRPYLQLLPSFAATACYFGKAEAGCTPEGQTEAARRFNREIYLPALYEGSALSETERRRVAEGLSALTGLAASDILANDLRVSVKTFSESLLADRGQKVGVYDSRFVLPRRRSGGDPVADDPAMTQYVPGFVGAWSDYARDVLKVETGRTYEAIAFREVNAKWDYGFGPGVPGGRNHAVDLAVAMTRNQSLRLLVATGYYDLQTPVGEAEYTITHAGVPLDRTLFRNYPSGHMPYLGRDSREALTRDVRAFLRNDR
ncbi:S10 family peptidase [Brevundimonas diminuta]|uniref:S10 family peptidase n=1 Tax=Brevundimonas diminuta TaxID=293 RepID=UPI0037C9F522